jgi:hypothetical protein
MNIKNRMLKMATQLNKKSSVAINSPHIIEILPNEEGLEGSCTLVIKVDNFVNKKNKVIEIQLVHADIDTQMDDIYIYLQNGQNVNENLYESLKFRTKKNNETDNEFYNQVADFIIKKYQKQ